MCAVGGGGGGGGKTLLQICVAEKDAKNHRSPMQYYQKKERQMLRRSKNAYVRCCPRGKGAGLELCVCRDRG